MSGNKKYIPVESNPEVFNSYTSKLGVNVAQHAFCDVFGLDEELLAMVPQPVLAVLMLFPVTDASEKAKAEEDARLKAERGSKQEAAERDVYFMRQTISNACGTIALLHAVGNNTDELSIDRGSFFEDFFQQTGGMDPVARAAFLESPPAGAPDIEKAHEEAARDGVTAPPAEDDDVNLHYAVFTLRDGHMWELDGRKNFPVDHGPSSRDTLLQDAVAAVRQFIATTDSIRFNLMALTTPQVFG